MTQDDPTEDWDEGYFAAPEEPEESDITTTDYKEFYQDGRLVLTVSADATTAQMWEGLRQYMEKSRWWPAVWFCSDHGNWMVLTDPAECAK